MAGIPETIGKYKITSLLAKGGMGAVYKAIHPHLKRNIIIKKLTIRGNAPVIERFKREAKILLDLRHPNIVHLHDYFKEGSSHYLVLEFVDGMSLDVLLKRKTSFSWQMALMITLDVCNALRYAHKHGIVHRDIKPANILISRRGEIKLADFGIAASEYMPESEAVAKAQAAGDSDKTIIQSPHMLFDDNLTQAGTALGTPSYMPPEQFSDSRTVDKRADIYAVGVMLYEMITGLKPHQSATMEEALRRIQKGKYISPRKLQPTLPHSVCGLIRKMMKPDPNRRFKDLQPVIRRIQRLLARYPLHDIRVTMVRNMLTQQIREPVFIPRKRMALRFALIAVACACVSLGVFVAWNAGMIHRVFLRAWYSPVYVSMELPPLMQDTADMQFRVSFFEDDNELIPEITYARRMLTAGKKAVEAKTGDQSVRLLLDTEAVWLPPGKYRIKIIAGPRIWWHTFTLDKADTHIRPDFGKIASRPLAVYASAFDVESDVDLSSKTRYSVFLDGVWTQLNSVAAHKLKTGMVWRFRAECEGYIPAVFSLKIDWFQDELFLETALQKAL